MALVQRTCKSGKIKNHIDCNFVRTKLRKMSCFYTFFILYYTVCICFAGFLYGLEQEQFYIDTVNVSRTERAIDDRFYFTASNTSSCGNLQNVASQKVGGSCNVVSLFLGMCLFQCRCLEETSSYVVSETKCMDERDFKEGCKYTFGSWTWRNGWIWDTYNDSLPILNIQSYGLTTAINASSRLFTTCELTSVHKYSEEGEWEALDPVFYQGTNSVFFKLQGMWHLSWIISELDFSRRHEIEGRFIRVNIKCSQNNVINGNVLSSDVSSCVALKITGNLTHRYTRNVTTEELLPTSKVETSVSIFSNRLVLIGVIAGSVLLQFVVVGIVVYCCYGKKYFKSRSLVQSEVAMRYNCNDTETVERV